MSGKLEYVMRSAQEFDDPHHRCHALGCERKVPPSLFMCKSHWALVPQHLKNAIWRFYRPGQERDKNPSEAYCVAAREAIEAVANREGAKRQPMLPFGPKVQGGRER